MKTAYLLTLTQQGISQPIGTSLLQENEISLIIKGINKINGSEGEYYQSYATEIEIYGDEKYPTDGSYKDGVRWAKMTWIIDEMDIITY